MSHGRDLPLGGCGMSERLMKRLWNIYERVGEHQNLLRSRWIKACNKKKTKKFCQKHWELQQRITQRLAELQHVRNECLRIRRNIAAWQED